MSENDQKQPDPASSATPPGGGAKPEQLLAKEAAFWDLQEERIGSLYARPHDWRFVPKLADIIIRPRVKTLLRLLGTHQKEIKSLVDIGCGNGWLCHATAKRGIFSYGIDLSPKKIETAKRMAKEQGIAHLCEFVAADVMDWRPPQSVDLLTSHGSLHHFPEFAKTLTFLVEHHLRPGGYMLFVEPNHEGMAPEVAQRLLWWAQHPFWKRFFDIDFYLEVTGKQTLDGPAAGGDEMNIRHESPAGVEFFGEHIHLDDFFREHYEVIERHFYHYYASHATNAFYVFMKSKLIRFAWRLMLPWIVRRETRLLRDPKYQQFAEDGLWFLRRKRDAAAR
ncbi:MAG: methyltransferase domain-containing protein [Planctomycetes bacterium]|nr:methyltransferase domain-containing protein [Planctomycetota bacterium]MCC7397934.1 methyltransferase domain-containing protein [Planctomycetota bacterium]